MSLCEFWQPGREASQLPHGEGLLLQVVAVAGDHLQVQVQVQVQGQVQVQVLGQVQGQVHVQVQGQVQV